MAAEVLRSEQDVTQVWPRWFVKLAKRLAQLEPGRVYDVTLIVPTGDGEPTWVVRDGAKVENGR